MNYNSGMSVHVVEIQEERSVANFYGLKRENNPKSSRTVYKIYFPIAILGKLFGLHPLVGLYEWKVVPQFIWWFFFQVLLPFVAVPVEGFTAYEKIRQALTDSKIALTGIIIFTLIVCRIIQSLTCTANMFFKSKKMVSLLKKLDHQDHLFAPKATRLKVTFYAIFGGICLIEISKDACVHMLFDHDDEVLLHYDSRFANALLVIFLHGNVLFILSRFLTEISYVGLHRVLLTSLRSLNAALSDILTNMESRDEHVCEKLASIRHSFKDSFDFACDMDAYFGSALLTLFLVNTVEPCVYFFSITAILSKEHTISKLIVLFFVLSLVPLSILIMICLVAHSTTTEAMKMLSILCGVKLPSDISQEVVNEIHLLGHMCNRLPLSFTASSYFTINKALLATIFGFVVSYLLIMMQFKS